MGGGEEMERVKLGGGKKSARQMERERENGRGIYTYLSMSRGHDGFIFIAEGKGRLCNCQKFRISCVDLIEHTIVQVRSSMIYIFTMH